MSNNFWPLVIYEYRKLFRRKIVWITLGAMTALCIFAACSCLLGNEYVNGQVYESHSEALEKKIAFAKALSGRALDDMLLSEMQEGYAKVPNIPLARVSGEYQAYARPYEAIWQYAFLLVGDPAYQTITEEELYAARSQKLEQGWTNEQLGSREKEYLRAAEEKVEKPFVFTYCEGWGVLANLMNMLCVLQLLLIAICIPPVFSGEHSCRTDQLIQSTGLGKKPLYLAKLLVGTTFSALSTLFLGMVLMGALFCVYGTEGADAALQLLNFKCVWPLTVGEGIRILFGLLLITALLRTVLAMLLSECFRSSTVPLALISGFLLSTLLFRIPEEYRLLSGIWNTIPANLVAVWEVFGSRLYPFFGTFLPPWQAAPVIYLLLSIGAAIWCLRQYEGFQAGGR